MGNAVVVERLLKRGASASIVDNKGLSAHNYAESGGSHKAQKLLRDQHEF